jgi:hypothetical protein
MRKHRSPDNNMMLLPIRKLCSLLGCVLLAAAVLTGCGRSTPPTPNAQAVTGPKIGETINVVDGVSIEVSSFTRTVGDQVSRAKRGRTWAMPTVLIKNESSQEIEVDPSDFTVTTSSGETAQADLDIHFLPMLEPVSLPAGESVQGRLGFDVPEEDQLVLYWNPKWATGQKVSINLIKP